MLRLKAQFTKRLARVYEIIDGMLIGRDSTNDIQILSQSVSRTHARLNLVDGAVVVTDLGSANGIKVNSKLVTIHTLKEGDRITIGETDMLFEKGTALPTDDELIQISLLRFAARDIGQLVSRNRIGLEFHTDDEEINRACQVGDSYILARNFPVDEHERLIIALREAVTNAQRHGNNNDAKRKIRISLRDDPDKLCIAVQDEGDGFDYQHSIRETKEKDAVTVVRERYREGRSGGLGIRLMQKCVDMIEYEEGGRRMLMTKYKRVPTPEEKEETVLTKDETVFMSDMLSKIQSSKINFMEDISFSGDEKE
jgi:serine/threonine-protein kinase RsbW